MKTNKGLPALPSIPTDVSPATRVFLEHMKHALEIQGGHRGNELDRSVTFRDLIDIGTIKISAGSLGSYIYEPADTSIDPTLPDTPFNLTAHVGLDWIGLTWEVLNTSNIAHFEIWRHTSDDRDTSLFHGISKSTIYVDTTVAENTDYFYWVRAVSYSGVAGLFNALAGTHGNTGLKIDTVIALLQGQITESELYANLNSRIDLIDTPITGLVDQFGALDSRVGVSETDINVLEATVDNPVTGVVANAAGLTVLDTRVTATENETTSNASAITGLEASVNHPTTGLAATVVIVDSLNVTVTQHGNDITATASAVTTLQASVGTNTSSIQTLQTVQNGLTAEYLVKLDVNGYVSGFGLYNDGSSASFIINSDNFAIGKPGQTDAFPFIIGTVDGQTRIVLDALTYIPDVSITDAKINGLNVNKLFAISGTFAEALIGSGHITNLMIGDYIQSDNWNGTIHQGWKIDKAGTAEFNSIQIWDGSTLIFSVGTGMEWSYVSGANRPEDNATVGADWNVNLTNIPPQIAVIYYQATAPSSPNTGDFWIDTDDDKQYRWSGSSWVLVQNSIINQALTDAATAQATADGKVFVFAQASAPTADGVGDLWIDTDDSNKMYRWSGSSWDAVYDTRIATALADASNAQATADGKIQSFYQTSAPTSGMDEGDLWVDTDDNNKLHRYNGSAWVNIQDASITAAQADASQALANAATAQSTADGKIITFVQDSAPTAEGIGDLWMDTNDNNKLHRWSGSAWTTYAQDSADWSRVFGANRPSDNADVTSNNPQAPSWLTSPVVWGGNQITPANISTYIADLAVDTLYIAGQAVTIPTSAYSTASNELIYPFVGNSPETLLSLSFTSTGAPVVLSGVLNVMNTGVGDDAVLLYIYQIKGVDTTLIYNPSSYHTEAGSSTNPIPFVIIDTPGVGAVTYELRAKADDDSNYAVARSMVALEVKK